MRVVIEARTPDPAHSGGVAHAIMSLAQGLSALPDGRDDEEYVFLTDDGAGDWLAPYARGRCRVHKVRGDRVRKLKRELLQTRTGRALRAVRRWVRSFGPPKIREKLALKPRLSDGVAESLSADLVHLPFQDAYVTSLPTVYQPHDLQFLHLPQYFDPEQIEWRKFHYRYYCSRARSVLVESTWTKRDVAERLDVPPEKIDVCPFPPPTIGYAAPTPRRVAAVKRKLRFPRFIYYPAQTWPHKNHLQLLEALAKLKRESDLVVPLVSSGHLSDFYPQIAARAKALDLVDQVQFLNYVPNAEVKLLYELCAAVVVPTKFESVSLPVWEAFEAGRPIACSRVTSLPMQVGEAGILFDPDSTADIAAAIRRLWLDERLRLDLVDKGTARLKQFSLGGTASHIRAIYRRTLNRATPEDLEILGAPPLI